MTNIYNGWISKTNWTLVVAILINIGNAVTPFMSASAAATVTTILGTLAIIFHIRGVNKAANASAQATAATMTGAVATPKSGQ